jgi:ADP-ribosylation factor-like protein 6
MKFWDSFLTWLKIKKKEANILIVGLDNSGKSTVVQYFQTGGKRTEVTVPTIGFKVEKFKSKTTQDSYFIFQ